MEMISEEINSHQVITVIDNRIDAAAAIRFKDQMKSLSAQTDFPVVLDLAAVEFVDSSGLGAIVASMKMLGKDRPLYLTGLTPIVAKVFALTRMEKVFRIFATKEEACDTKAAKSA